MAEQQNPLTPWNSTIVDKQIVEHLPVVYSAGGQFATVDHLEHRRHHQIDQGCAGPAPLDTTGLDIARERAYSYRSSRRSGDARVDDRSAVGLKKPHNEKGGGVSYPPFSLLSFVSIVHKRFRYA